MIKASSFDVQITQQGDVYIASGKDAAALHAKLEMLPVGAKTLEIGALENGSFTIKKIMPLKSGYSEPKTTAKAG